MAMLILSAHNKNIWRKIEPKKKKKKCASTCETEENEGRDREY